MTPACIGDQRNVCAKETPSRTKVIVGKALDICRSSETTSKQLRNMTVFTDESAEHEIKVIRQQRYGNRRRESFKPREKRRCKFCGETHEFDKNSCPAYGKSCNNCGIRNHFSKVCQKKRDENDRTIREVTKVKDASSDSGDSVYSVSMSPEFSDDEEIYAMCTRHEQFKSRIIAAMSIKGGRETKFQVDTGATCNVIKQSELSGTKYMSKLKKTKQVLRMYNSSTLKPVGQSVVQLQNPETRKKYKVKFTVIDSENCSNLLGSRAAQQMGLVDVNYDNMKIVAEQDSIKLDKHTKMMSSELNVIEKQTHSVLTSPEPSQNGLTMEDITSEYKYVFEGLGRLGAKLHLEVDETVKPVQQAVRKIPESMKIPLKHHLAELEKKGIIEKLYQPTQWVNSIVVAKKSNGSIRLCLDPRPLNSALKRCHHPMQTIEDILPELGKAKIFFSVKGRMLQ